MSTLIEQYGDVIIPVMGILAGFAMLISCFAVYAQTAGCLLDAVLFR